MWARVDAAANTVTAEIINPQTVTVDGTTHPSQIFSLWSDSELKDIEVYTMTVEDVDANYYNIDWSSVSYTVNNDAGTVIKHPTKSAKDFFQAKTDLIIEVTPSIVKDDYSGIIKQDYHKEAEEKSLSK